MTTQTMTKAQQRQEARARFVMPYKVEVTA